MTDQTDLYYRIQSALSPHMISMTELMAAMSSIWPIIEGEADELKQHIERLLDVIDGVGGDAEHPPGDDK